MRCRDLLLVTRVFPVTSTWQLHAVEEGMVLQSANGRAVRTLAELRAATADGPYAVLKFKDGPLIVVDVARDAEEMRKAMEANGIASASELERMLERGRG